VRDEVVIGNDTLLGAGVTILKNTREFELYIPESSNYIMR
jgi:hypothetical protein